MRKTLLASAATALILAAGFASAAESTDSLELIYTAQASCAFQLLDESIEANEGGASVDPTYGLSSGSGMVTEAQLDVACSTSVPYTIETDAGIGGLVNLVGDATGGTVPTYIRQGQYNGSIAAAWGSLANGEHYAGVGTGTFQRIDYHVAMNQNADGTFRPMAIPDTYRATTTYTLSY